MLTFLFWNINGNDVTDTLARLAFEHHVDIVVLAESKIPSEFLAQSLSGDVETSFQFAAGREPTRVEFFTRFDPRYLELALEASRYSIRRLRLPGRIDVTVAAAHLLSASRDPDSRTLGARLFATDIKEIEARVEHSRTVVFGDLNMNPFDKGMAELDALNGVMSIETAQKIRRRHAGTDYPFFYNPMWARMGSHMDRPPGTYYYDKSGEPRYYWNVFDQVLIRPALIQYWNDSDLRVLTGVGDQTFLMGSGIPNLEQYSDQLYGRRLLPRRFITFDPSPTVVINPSKAGFRPNSGDVRPGKIGGEASVVRTVIPIIFRYFFASICEGRYSNDGSNSTNKPWWSQ